MARPTSFGKDTGLQVRMVFVLFLLGAVYAGLVAALIAAGVNGALVAVIAIVLLLVQLFASDKIGLAAMGAHEVTPEQAPELHAMIERLCVQADLPKPKVAIAEMRLPNAFAIGRSPKSATVCVTTGLLQMLTPAELEGVLAHELTHVLNRDVLVMTIASFFAMIAAYIVQFGFFFGDDDSEEGGLGVLGLVLVSLVVYAVSFVLMQALSRYREYAADRGSAVITGRPSALASALMKIDGISSRIPVDDLRSTQRLRAFYIYWPEHIGELFASHPSTEKRIAALQRLESQLQGAIPAAA